MEDQQDAVYMTAMEAAAELGVTKVKMAEMLRYGILKWEPNQFDLRVKLVRVADVEQLKRQRQAALHIRGRVADPKARARRTSSAA